MECIIKIPRVKQPVLSRAPMILNYTGIADDQCHDEGTCWTSLRNKPGAYLLFSDPETLTDSLNTCLVHLDHSEIEAIENYVTIYLDNFILFVSYFAQFLE